MTDIELLVDFHKDAMRQGPGSEIETKKALGLLNIQKNDNLKIADIGCGTGSQTITLAQNTYAQITAVDIFPEFLQKLDARAKELNLQARITTMEMSMENLNFAKNEFDLIWSEGAIYNIGFEKGLREWGQFVKPGGYLAVSEISWITDSRPKEIEQYWSNEYHDIGTISKKIRQIEETGYTPIAHFILPPYCWMDNYYKPMEKRFSKFLAKHDNSDSVVDIVETEKKEIAIYKKFKDYYSYGFYMAQKKY